MKPSPDSTSSLRSSGVDVTTDAGVKVAAALGETEKYAGRGRALKVAGRARNGRTAEGPIRSKLRDVYMRVLMPYQKPTAKELLISGCKMEDYTSRRKVLMQQLCNEV
jgi:hypothetical protein